MNNIKRCCDKFEECIKKRMYDVYEISIDNIHPKHTKQIASFTPVGFLSPGPRETVGLVYCPSCGTKVEFEEEENKSCCESFSDFYPYFLLGKNMPIPSLAVTDSATGAMMFLNTLRYCPWCSTELNKEKDDAA